jgi:hypothetical protein
LWRGPTEPPVSCSASPVPAGHDVLHGHLDTMSRPDVRIRRDTEVIMTPTSDRTISPRHRPDGSAGLDPNPLHGIGDDGVAQVDVCADGSPARSAHRPGGCGDGPELRGGGMPEAARHHRPPRPALLLQQAFPHPPLPWVGAQDAQPQQLRQADPSAGPRSCARTAETANPAVTVRSRSAYGSVASTSTGPLTADGCRWHRQRRRGRPGSGLRTPPQAWSPRARRPGCGRFR